MHRSVAFFPWEHERCFAHQPWGLFVRGAKAVVRPRKSLAQTDLALSVNDVVKDVRSLGCLVGKPEVARPEGSGQAEVPLLAVEWGRDGAGWVLRRRRVRPVGRGRTRPSGTPDRTGGPQTSS